MIRRARESDLDALYDLEGRCFAERRFRRDHVLFILRNPKAQTHVYDGDGTIVGSLMILDEGSVTRVLSVGVHPDRRRRGIGRALMAVAEEEAGRLGATDVCLEVNTKNEAAIAFYKSLGYEVLERLPKYYSWGDDALAMAKGVAMPIPRRRRLGRRLE